MLLKMPAYCEKFKCTADRCSDSCCIGWEIDIDESSAVRYRAQEGEIGERLRASMNDADPAGFVLDEQERCPFLNSQGLCDLILTLGEEALCQICTEHPRYYCWFGDIKEGGIGLCCEEAARLILTWNDSFSVTEYTIPEEPDMECDTTLLSELDKARMRIINHLECDAIPLQQRIADVLSYGEMLEYALNAEEPLPECIEAAPRCPVFPMDTILEMMLHLEPMGAQWHPFVEKCRRISSEDTAGALALHPETERYLQNIAIYFVWRYFLQSAHDGDLLGHLGFMAGSTAVIAHMFGCQLLCEGTLSQADCIRIAVNYSKEIEYAEENRIAMEDAFYACLG